MSMEIKTFIENCLNSIDNALSSKNFIREITVFLFDFIELSSRAHYLISYSNIEYK